MTITIYDIQKAFDDLETEATSREAVSEFAVTAMQANDQGILKMEPRSEADRIWKAIKYFSGVDLKEDPDTYLHSKENFASYRKQIGIPKSS